MIFEVLVIFDDLPALGSSPRHRGERRILIARWTLGLALAGIITGWAAFIIAVILRALGS